MTIKRYGTGSTGAGGQSLPFARATQADGWLYVSGQVAMKDGEVIDGGIIAQSHQAIQNMLAIVEEAGYGPGLLVFTKMACHRAHDEFHRSGMA